MCAGGRGYPQAAKQNRTLEQEHETTVVNVQGEPVFDEVIRIDASTISLTDLLSSDEGAPRGLRGWRLA